MLDDEALFFLPYEMDFFPASVFVKQIPRCRIYLMPARPLSEPVGFNVPGKR